MRKASKAMTQPTSRCGLEQVARIDPLNPSSIIRQHRFDGACPQRQPVKGGSMGSVPLPQSAAAPADSAPWYAELSSACWRTLALAGSAWAFDVFDSFLLSLTMPALVVVFSLSKADAGAIGSILAAGLVCGGSGFGWGAARLG